MRNVTVVGGGFSGLVTAYYLVKRGLTVRISERCSRVGGMLRTIRTPHGLVETAANGIRNSARLEAMCADIGVPLQPTRSQARARYIYRDGPRRFPLKLSESLRLVFGTATHAGTLRPKPFETIAGWGQRVLGPGATDYFLSPALGGIYAGDSKVLSASLIFHKNGIANGVRGASPPRPRLRGTVAPPNGMQQLIDGLRRYLEHAGVEFTLNSAARADAGEPVVICTPPRAAAEYLREISPDLSQQLQEIEMLPLVTATCFYPSHSEKLNGFGCLFPRSEGFRALGVLFNTCIFDGRGPADSETWIFGGALDREVISLSEQELSQLIAAERRQLCRVDKEVLAMHPHYWPEALPHYSINLERALTSLSPLPPDVALVGNYLGGLGLGKIIDRAAQVATQFGRAA
ncbi:MAG TPA: FAD-dependent oxidoreductase [Pyrinomonadaceae bacterium]|nr:FAD-dependent oxidoreductase [Pyrinomonadaceae bacterium]